MCVIYKKALGPIQVPLLNTMCNASFNTGGMFVIKYNNKQTYCMRGDRSGPLNQLMQVSVCYCKLSIRYHSASMMLSLQTNYFSCSHIGLRFFFTLENNNSSNTFLEKKTTYRIIKSVTVP